MPQRRNSYITRQETGVDEFIVFVTGLAPTASWVDLKDLARQWLGEEIRRTKEYEVSWLQPENGANVARADGHGREVERILGRVQVYPNSERQFRWGYIPVKGEEHGREVYAYASNCVWKGYQLIATMGKRNTPTSQNLGLASVGRPQPYPHSSVIGGFQPHSTTVVPVPYLPSGDHGHSSLSTVSAVPEPSGARGYENNVQAYCYYQPTPDTTCFLANGQSSPSAYEEQIVKYQRANSHWIGAPALWSHQPEYPGNGYGAGPWVLFEEPHARDTGSGAPPWATSHSTLPGPQYLPVTGAMLYSVPSVMPMDPSQSVPGQSQPLQYVRLAPLQLAHTNDDGTPINVSDGAVPTEARGVFIHNLSYEATSADVENLMRDAGHIVRCEVNTHTGTGRSKGSATVTFTSAEDVIKALEMFNGTLFMGRPLTVRLDKDKVTQSLTNQQPNSDAEVSTEASSGQT